MGTSEVLLGVKLVRRARLLLVQVAPVAAAAEADASDPHRVIYWSAIYIERESQRLEREYTRMLTQLRLWRMLRAPG